MSKFSMILRAGEKVYQRTNDQTAAAPTSNASQTQVGTPLAAAGAVAVFAATGV
jgi:hypothetical protein